ncbi:PAS domain S-box protein [Chiayiivirga flava]|uniref:histidine kinase n=1 Tax=Chiayiivirga flava TaxID=659595 RepID=A0A7W8D4B7_9GAMM|nr:PAS domain S-box protein [Chiayiivirga flava]MBB5206535.1 PAS domain S-box-containing protein [Chiayiivirga flava]
MLRELLDIVPDALLVVDGDGRIAQANAQAGRLFGFAHGELIGRSIETLMPAGVRDRHRRHRAHYMDDPHVRPMGGTGQSLVGLRADGVEFPVEIALSPIATQDGLRYLASIRDISETQRARQAIVRSHYDAVVARFGQRAIESDSTSAVLDQAAPAIAEALGIATVLLGFVGADRQDMLVQASVGSDGHESVLTALLDTARAPLRDVLETGRYAIHAPQRGAGDPTHALMMPLLDRRGTMGVLVCLGPGPDTFDHDALHLVQSFATMISAFVQRRRTEEQLAHSQRLDAIGQLTGGIAHDFNNLLTVLSGALQMLEAEYPGNAEAQDLIATAARSADRGAELTAKLLAFARRQSLAPRVIDVAELLRDVQRMLKRTLGDGIELRLECASGLRSAFADPAQLDAALVNLALNARDAMPRGGEIDLSAKNVTLQGMGGDEDLPPGAYVLITVSDTGMGMSPDTLARAMEPFFTTKQAGRGSGLGLSMVYGFARQSGGQLRIASSLGYGTQVKLYLPVADGVGETPTPAPARIESPTRASETILVVEDDADVARVAVACLERGGYRVVLAASADAALAALRADPDIALLFSDVRLGAGRNGRELAAAARDLRPGLPVLLASGFDNEVPASALPLLRKPYRLDVLAATVRRMLDAA